MRLPDSERSRAVLIGTSRYSDPKLPDLPAVRDTIEDLAATLTHPAYGGLSDRHCTVLLDEGDIQQVGRSLRATAAGAEDLLLVYYVGHGLIAPRRQDLYLSLADSEFEDPEFGSLEYRKLRDVVLDSRATSKVIILDCCFSGRALSGTMAGPEAAVLGQVDVAGTYVMASSQGNEVSLIQDGEKNTAFTGRLIRLLRDGVAGGPELLSIDEVYRRLQTTMTAEGLPAPLQRGSRNAPLLALARNRAHRLPDDPARHEAAVALCEAGQYAEAAEAFGALLEEQESLLGADHVATLRTRQWLAHTRGGAGAPAESADRLREIHARQTRLLGPDHPDTLRSRQFLAVNLGESGRRPEAIRMLRLLLLDRRRVLGGDDVATLRTRHVLAHNLALTGEPDEAAALLRELVADRERVLGPDHPHTLRARRDLSELVVGG